MTQRSLLCHGEPVKKMSSKRSCSREDLYLASTTPMRMYPDGRYYQTVAVTDNLRRSSLTPPSSEAWIS